MRAHFIQWKAKALCYLFFPFLFFFMIGMPESSATHFMGVDITYQCLPGGNGCVYRIFHNTYYDCGGAATTPLPGPPFPPSLQAFQPTSCIQPTIVGQWTYVSYTEVTPICASTSTLCTNANAVINGVLEARYYADYNFCNTNCNVYNIVWGSCCRNGAITSGAANDGIYTAQTQIDLSHSPCNNSPYFTSIPVSLICVGSGSIFNQGAYDPDGDSLVYSLIACKDNATSNVGYNIGYSPTTPLGPSWQVNLDPLTGQLAIIPNPGNAVVGVICVLVEEYRNGAVIGSVTRDMQVASYNCPGTNSLPVVDSVNWVRGGLQSSPNRYKMTLQDSLILDIYASDANTNQDVTVKAATFYPGLQVNSGISNPVTATVKYAPQNYGSFFMPISIKDNYCPLVGQSLSWLLVDVVSHYATGVVTNTPCGQNLGAIDLTVSGLNAPFQFLWSTGDTTEDISGLGTGRYTVAITDNAFNIARDTFYVNGGNIGVTGSVFQPFCANPQSGSITLTVTGGTPPYTYAWNTGATTANLTGLTTGGYSVDITDANGCSKHAAFVVAPRNNCFNLVEGYVFEDVNGNCVYDAGEPPIVNKIVDISPGGAVMTDHQGKYSVQLPTGSFSLTVHPGRWQRVTCLTGGSHNMTFTNVGNTLPNLNFAIETDSVLEISVHATAPRVRPGMNATHNFVVQNNGHRTVSGTLTWTHDSVFTVASSTPTMSQYNATTGVASWNFSNLGPYQTLYFQVTSQNPSTTPLGTIYTNNLSLTPVVGDTLPGNNSLLIQDSVRASFDPNDKQVLPKGMGPLGLIEQSEQQMNYTVRFQNTGTDTAFYVIIRDTIDTRHLDVFSFQGLTESHPYSLTIENDEVLVFRFDNILLPDSATNLAGSQGFVTFRMDHTGTLPVGSQIENSAAIYFDFNAPIITNKVLNTVFAYPGVELPGDTLVCDNEPVVATISSPGLPPYEFRWSNGHVDAGNHLGISQTTFSTSGTYQLTVTDSLGISVQKSIQVTAIPSPDAAFNFVKNGQTVTFTNTSSGNASWFWDFGDGQSTTGGANEMHSYASKGLYTVTLIVSNDCGSDTVTQLVDLRNVGIGEDLFSRSIHITPHPVRDVSYLRFANPQGESFRLRLLDLQGRVVREYAPQRGEVFEIARGDLGAGVYLYELIGDQSYFGKMVVR